MANNVNNGRLGHAQVTVVMVPFPAQGHLNQLLHLSRLISAYNIPVHYVGTATHNRQAKLRVHGLDPISISNIHFHDFPIPSFTSLPPNPHASNKFPSHLQPLFDALPGLREPIAKLMTSLSTTTKRLVVIHDSLVASVVQDIVSIQNGESYTFHSLSAYCIFWFSYEFMGKPFVVETEKVEQIPSFMSDDCFSPEFLEYIVAQDSCLTFNSGNLYNSCKQVESKYIELLANEQLTGGIKQWAIGPFNPVSISLNETSNQRDKRLRWLDEQAPDSVIYVCFGTTSSLGDEQIHEIAIGLEKSEQKFMWVLRDADKGDIFEGDVRKNELAKGYEQRIEGQGMIVRDWAPQLEILAHASIGGFLSHCGWNSCMESMSMGVPMAAWPMHSDQPWNAKLIANVLKIGIIVREWESRNELVTCSRVEECVKMLMASEGGVEMRKKARELGEIVRKSVEKGGVTRLEMDSFIAHISRAV